MKIRKINAIHPLGADVFKKPYFLHSPSKLRFIADGVDRDGIKLKLFCSFHLNARERCMHF